MRFLRGGDAVIIDLRRNGGGSPDAVQYLVSHFLEPNRPLVTFYMRRQPGRHVGDAGRASGRPDGRQAALRADQRRHRQRRRGIHRPCRRLQARRAGRRNHRRRRLPQRVLAGPRRLRAQRFGRPRGPRLDRPRLGSGRHRADHPDRGDGARCAADARAAPAGVQPRRARTSASSKRRRTVLEAQGHAGSDRASARRLCRTPMASGS